MEKSKEELQRLLQLLDMERNEERRQWRDRFLNTSLEQRVKEGTSWYPVVVDSEEIGLGDRIVLEISRNAADERGLFQNGSIAALWCNAEAYRKDPPSVTGVVIKAMKDKVILALDTDDTPDWIDEGKLGLDLSYDERGYKEMVRAINDVMSAQRDRLAELREVLLGQKAVSVDSRLGGAEFPELNPSQNDAVQLVRMAEDLAIVHGPPGTGKTTTLVRAIADTLKKEKQVLVCAASNLATDLLTEKLANQGIRVLRLGHPARVSEVVLQHSLDLQVSLHPSYKDMKKFRRDAESIRKQATKFKRNFGKEEREKRKELLQEAKDCQKQARDLEDFILQDLLGKAQAVTCTLTGAATSMLKGKHFSTLFIDEAAQATEPACWIPIRLADRVVFAGDHCQLPPTVKSQEAARAGFAVSLFEKCISRHPEAACMLRTQYRMHAQIMGFSNHAFYKDGLRADESVVDHRLSEDPEKPLLNKPLEFIDTAGCGYEEKLNPETKSLSNPGEADILFAHLMELCEALRSQKGWPSLGIISPYKDQVLLLRERLEQVAIHNGWRPFITVDTVDGFQGQERDIIYISMVRSNNEGGIGFLGDTRRMNVAMTRARKKLVLIGDSGTLALHPFYRDFLDYIDSQGAYVSAWDYVHLVGQ
ncbi:MAG: AAA family ATPase [Bacteroidia bacterium]|nr:AAA family ATPase [Bacteroidia bacterium]